MRAHIIESSKVINTILVESLDFMPGLVDASIGGNIGDLWDGTIFTTPPPTPPTREELKVVRETAVAAIKVTTTTGKTFDGDELSQTRMARAIIGMQAISRETITWTLADNTIVQATLSELIEALCLAGEQQAQLWPIEA